MLLLFYKLPRNIGKIFSGYNLFWHILAIALTYIIVASGLDWTYLKFFRHSAIFSFFFPGAGFLGILLPIFVPLGILVLGKIRKNLRTINTAWALGQAGILGLLVSGFYKVLTGRPGPMYFRIITDLNTSKVFHFGFLRGGVFWGWPSTHTLVAVAVGITLLILYPKNKIFKFLAIAVALYIGFGASISFHWFSDCVAGAIIGTVIGIVVGRSFLARLKKNNK